jgi:hypothetical protein
MPHKQEVLEAFQLRPELQGRLALTPACAPTAAAPARAPRRPTGALRGAADAAALRPHEHQRHQGGVL